MTHLPAYRLKLYRNFKALKPSGYYGIVHFYEQHEEAIRQLGQEEYFDCTLAYTEALFHIGNYRQHLVMCDHLLEQVMLHNINTWGGDDIYTRLLLQKAKTLLRIHETQRSEHVLRELVKLHPYEKQFEVLLRNCLLRQKSAWKHRCRSTTIVLVFLAVAAIGVELFVVRRFFIDWYEKALLLHNGLLIASVLVLVAGEYGHFRACRRVASSFVQKIRAKKALSP